LFLEQLKNWVVNKTDAINKKSENGFSQDILDICVAFYMNQVATDLNINGMIHYAL